MFRLSYHLPGTPPGTLLSREDARGRTNLSLFRYSVSEYVEIREAKVEQINEIRKPNSILWVNVQGLKEVEIIQGVGNLFGLHLLALEDVMNFGQRPRVEFFEDHLFIISSMVYFRSENELATEQLSIFLGKDYVVTFQEEKGGDFFERIRERIRLGRGYIRKMKSDYLVFALLDAIVDSYYPIVESIGENLSELEEKLLVNPSKEDLVSLHESKRLLMEVRRQAWPHREVFANLLRDDTGLIRRETRLFWRDCYEHTTQILDIVENCRDLAAGLMDIYLSSVGLRTNEIMRILTLVSTFFIPLTFLAGVYGMNFDLESPFNMPELKFRYGYLFFWFFCVLISLGMFVYFRKKKWL
ncbi:MAG: magnesium/cobalt transporter CorA [Chthoniobacterales bacterium]|nr:magnesium/cobalt transporter CorA [Chthoniobacterales bacterium]